ncbi:hypothetical protein [Gallaecimonas pentaromativorans]|uniref:hypothetical protein n=1 Tax=Gallaecimonas pentaromativorans TaxID=584787 RepID=UPI003A925EE1
MKRIYLSCIAVLLFSGCASQGPELSESKYADLPVQHEFPEEKGVHKLRQQEDVITVADGKVKERLVCEYIKPTGSHMTKRYCRTREEMERSEESAKNLFRNAANPGRQQGF